jgi:hypothetical protein
MIGDTTENLTIDSQFRPYKQNLARIGSSQARNPLKLRCSFGIMEFELNRNVSGEVPEASRNTIYEVIREMSGENT